MSQDPMRTIMVSIGLGIVVQIIALLIVRSFGPKNVVAGWGIGSVLRFAVLVVYGWAIVPALGLSLTPALVTLAIVFFLTMLLEPFLLSK